MLWLSPTDPWTPPPFLLCPCTHLQKLKPEYSKAATTMNEHDASIIIGKVRVLSGGWVFGLAVTLCAPKQLR